jgi:hypothetical protein
MPQRCIYDAQALVLPLYPFALRACAASACPRIRIFDPNLKYSSESIPCRSGCEASIERSFAPTRLSIFYSLTLMCTGLWRHYRLTLICADTFESITR